MTRDVTSHCQTLSAKIITNDSLVSIVVIFADPILHLLLLCLRPRTCDSRVEDGMAGRVATPPVVSAEVTRDWRLVAAAASWRVTDNGDDTGNDDPHLVGVEDDEVAQRPGVRVLDEDLRLGGAGGLQQHGHPALPLQHQAPATSLALNIEN